MGVPTGVLIARTAGGAKPAVGGARKGFQALNEAKLKPGGKHRLVQKSAFGVDHQVSKASYKFNPDADKKEKAKFIAGRTAMTGAGVGAAVHHYVGSMKRLPEQVHRDLAAYPDKNALAGSSAKQFALGAKSGMKAAGHQLKSKAGIAAAGIYGAALGGNIYQAHRAKKKGLLVKKNYTSPFGLEHGAVHKASILGAGDVLNRGVGAGGMAARKLGQAMGAPKVASKVNYAGARSAAKASGRQAARHFASGNTGPASQGMRFANTGWQQRAAAFQNLGAQTSGKAPVGMRGPIASRVKTGKMKENESRFL